MHYWAEPLNQVSGRKVVVVEDEEIVREVICASLELDGHQVFEAEDGNVVGYITTRLDRDSGIGWIPNLAVDPGQQGAGVGRQLMEHALAYMREEGMEAAKIETLQQNDVGSNFYPSVGFEEVGLQIHYLMRL